MAMMAMGSFVAVVAAFLGNRLLYRLSGRWAVVTLVPWWEEVCKGLVIWLLPGEPALAVHLLFGLMEGLYGMLRGERFLGLTGLSVHGLAGGVAAWVLRLAPLFTAIWVAALVHTVANLAVLGLVLPTLGLPGLSLQMDVDPRYGGRYNERK